MSCTRPAGSNLVSARSQKIPVIFDTDICFDIDDTWALVLLLKCPEFDVKLITTAVGDTRAKAKVVAKLLEIAGRTDIPIGIGAPLGSRSRSYAQDEWVKDYDLSSYPGLIYEDGVQAIVDTIMNSAQPIKVIAVGPLPNIAAALDRQPKIADKAEFVAMLGSIRRGYGGKPQANAEYNVKAFVKEAQKVFTADWDMTITPLDTCGIVWLAGEKYRKVFNCNDPVVRALMDNYYVWLKHRFLTKHKDLGESARDAKVEFKFNTGSTILFDTVAVYLATSTELVKTEKLGIRVTDDGYTAIADNAKKINCATQWKDLEAFEDFLVERLTKYTDLNSTHAVPVFYPGK